MKKFSDIYEAVQIDPVLKKQRAALKQRIREWKAKGKDTTPLEDQLAALEEQIKASQAAGATAPTSTPAPNNTVKTTSKPAATKPTSTSQIQNKQEYDDGYKAAIEAWKQAKSGKAQQSSGGGGGQGDSGLAPIPLDPEDFDKQQQDAQNQQSGQGSRGKGSQGVVRPEDCMPAGAGSLDKTPSTVGGMIDKTDGDKLAEAEGYDKAGGSQEALDKEWADAGRQAASKMQGKGAGWDRLKAKLDGLYRITKDWRKELKKIVGQSISPDEKRSAYANKNVLVSQNRIARTDKDRFDNTDFILAAIDTSGSMSEEYLRQCLAEVYGVALAKKPLKIVVVQFDTRVADIQEYRSIGELKKSLKTATLKGGGGTDCKCIWDLMKKDRRYMRPCDCVMIFTDGYLDQYKRDPMHMKNLIWVVIDNMGFDLKFKDMQTKCIRIKTEDMR